MLGSSEKLGALNLTSIWCSCDLMFDSLHSEERRTMTTMGQRTYSAFSLYSLILCPVDIG